ncbi:MAG: DMT family transporter [Candidatus Thorarchaeota archaeon]
MVTSISQPMTVGFFRYAIAGLLFLLLLHSNGVSPRTLFNRDTMPALVLGGITGVFGFTYLSLVGTRFTTAGQASIIAGINPITVSFFAYLLHRELLASRGRYLGIVLAFLGIVFVVGIQALLEFNLDYLAGNMILIISMLSWGVYSSTSKIAMQNLTPVEATAGSIFVGWFLFCIGTVTELESLKQVLLIAEFWWNVIFLGAISAFFGFLMYFEAVKRIGVTRTGSFTSLIPLFGTATSIILLEEQILWTFTVGLVLVVLGIIILNAPGNEESTETSAHIPSEV